MLIPTPSPVRPPTSVERGLSVAFRWTLNVVPTTALGRASVALRNVLALLGRQEGSLTVTKLGPHLQEIKPPARDQLATSATDAVIYIHGGAFSLVDSTDLFFYDRLVSLPRNGGGMPALYTVVYDVNATHVAIRRQVRDAYMHVTTILGKRVVCLVGDSAGGNLAVSLCLDHHVEGFQQPKSLVLLSPWVDLLSTAPATARNTDVDYLCDAWLRRSVAQYAGPVAARRLEATGRARAAAVLARALTGAHSRVKVVVFDMDQCMVARHSWGRLRREAADLGDFLSRVTPDFALLARAVHARGGRLAVATHSDSAEYASPFVSRDTHIMGEDLVRAVLAHAVPDIQHAFHVVAYNPRVRGVTDPSDAHKKKHIREIAAHYGVATSACLLYDDDEGNCADTGRMFATVRVDPRVGLRLTAALADATLRAACADGNDVEAWVAAAVEEDEAAAAVPGSDGNVNGDDDIDLCLLSPSLATNAQLGQLPPALVCAGGDELFVDDVVAFSRRLMAAQPHRQGEAGGPRSRLVVAAGDVHAYPVFWRHPAHRVLAPLGLLWLFRWLLPGRAAVEAAAKPTDIAAAADKTHPVRPVPAVHSRAADDFIKDAWDFINQARS